LKNKDQTLPENFQSKSAQNFSIKVWLQNVKLFCNDSGSVFTTEHVTRHRVFIRSLPEKFQARSAEKFSIRVWSKKENQSLIDPDRFFNRNRDRDWFFPGRI